MCATDIRYALRRPSMTACLSLLTLSTPTADNASPIFRCSMTAASLLTTLRLRSVSFWVRWVLTDPTGWRRNSYNIDPLNGFLLYTWIVIVDLALPKPYQTYSTLFLSLWYSLDMLKILLTQNKVCNDCSSHHIFVILVIDFENIVTKCYSWCRYLNFGNLTFKYW